MSTHPETMEELLAAKETESALRPLRESGSEQRRARSRREWQRMEDLRASGETIEANVLEANRGGVVVDVGIRGFVPQPVRALVGQRLRLRVLESDPKRDRLILSEMSATQQLRRDRKAQDGVEGLIHVSELAPKRVADPSEVVHVGDRLPVKVVSIDRERRRLSLSSRLAETQ